MAHTPFSRVRPDIEPVNLYAGYLSTDTGKPDIAIKDILINLFVFI